MRNLFCVKITSLTLVIIMLLGAMPLFSITSIATELNELEAIKQEVLSSSDDLIKEVEQREGVTKDRSEIAPWAQAGVYVDGVLVAQGDFSSMWNRAMEYAPNTDANTTDKQIEQMKEVEYVFNASMLYDYTWFGEETMTVSGKKFTIDLNGHSLARTDNGGSVIMVDNYSALTIMDSDPNSDTFYYNVSNELLKESGFDSPNIKGGVISGGYYRTGDGGGLYIDNHSTVRMLGGTIIGNKADVGSGAYLDNGSTLDMRGGNAQICYNYSAGTSSDGGAIFLRSNCSVYGGNVHHNLADDYGGGIRAKGENIIISGVAVHHNRALDMGGGIYIERSNNKQAVTVDNCIITNNYADDEGGGIYIYDLLLAKLNDCIIQNNAAASEGGGVFLTDHTGTDVQLSGKMIIRNNFVASFERMYSNYKSNLFIEGEDDLIASSLAYGSEIWVRIEDDIEDYCGSDDPITAEPTSDSPYYFFSDVAGWHIALQEVPAEENFRHLYFASGERKTDLIKPLKDYSTKLMSEPYKVRNGEFKDLEVGLYRGYSEYVLVSTEDYLPAIPFYYSDGYFLEDPKVYNEHLATMSACLAFSAQGLQSDVVEGNRYANHFSMIKQLYAEIGCSDEDFFVNDDYCIEPEFFGSGERVSTVGVAISQKKISAGDKEYILMPISIRGGDYGVEWAANALIGGSGEAKGFSDAADEVYRCVEEYIVSHGLEEEVRQGSIKFWVTGYSRAGATANLAAKRFVDNYAESGNQVYCYTMEAPKGGIEAEKLKADHTDNGDYLTIHNIINENDIVPLLAPAEMGFIRYGCDHLIGADYKKGNSVSYDVNSVYYKQRVKMVAQLKAMAPYLYFNDYWEIADVNIILGNIPIIGTDIIDKGEQSWDDPNPECRDIYTFLTWFLKRLQLDGIAGGDNIDPREAYSSVAPLANINGNYEENLPYSHYLYNFGYSDYTLEQAISGLMQVLFTIPDDKSDKLMDTIMNNALSYIYDELNIFDLLGLYYDAINNWDENTDLEKAQLINELLQSLLNQSRKTPIWNELTDEQSEILANSLPVLMWVVLDYASEDYNTYGDNDDGMWGVGTFVNNMSNIILNHYPEVTLAWLRSYDSYYANDLQAYSIENEHTQAPVCDADINPGKITLSAEKGSSIFYSHDGGKTWELYITPIDASEITSESKAFAVSYEVKSQTIDLTLGERVGSMIIDRGYAFLIGGVGIIAVGFLVAVIIRRKNKIQN